MRALVRKFLLKKGQDFSAILVYVNVKADWFSKHAILRTPDANDLDIL